MKSLIRNLAVLGVFAATAVPSFAVVLSFSFDGTFTNVAGFHSVTTTVTDDTSDIAVSGLDYSYSLDGSNNVIGAEGTVTFTNLSKVYFAFDGSQSANSMSGSILSFYGDAAHMIPLTNSGGSLSYDIDEQTSVVSQGQFVGTYEAVPEPASIAAMALGLGGLISRRKRGSKRA